MIKVPQSDRAFSQTNRSTIMGASVSYGNQGNLAGSFNLDMYTNRGKIRVSPRMLKNVNSTDLVNMGLPIAFRQYYFPATSTYTVWAAAGARMFYINNVTAIDLHSAFIQDATSGTPTSLDSTYSDMEINNGALYITGTGSTNNVHKFDGTTWSNITAANGAASVPRMLCSFGNRMYMSELATSTKASIISWDSSDTVVNTIGSQNTIVVGSATQGGEDTNVITFMRVAQNRIFIGTMNTMGGKGNVYIWDGTQPTNFDKTIRLQSSGALACVVKDDIPYIIDTKGFLMRYNGANFEEVARLPFYNKVYPFWESTLNNRFIHPNGMSIWNGKIQVLVQTEEYTNTSASAGKRPVEEYCPAGVWEYDESIGLYHRLSISYTPATGGTVSDYGQMRLSTAVGALTDVPVTLSASNTNGTILAGTQYYTDDSSTLFGIHFEDTNDTIQKWGYFITTELQSTEIESTWTQIYVKYRRFLNSADTITIKYRTVQDVPTDAGITWTSTSSFTTTDNISAYAAGDEVQVTKGTGSGKSAHILTNTVNAGTYTVTLDDTFTGATGTARASLAHWIKVGTVTELVKQFKKLGLPLPNNDTRIQFKVCMRFLGYDEFEQLIVIDKPEVYAV